MFAFLLFHTKHTKKVFIEGGGLRRGGIERKSNLFFSNSLLVEKGVSLLGYRQNFKETGKIFKQSQLYKTHAQTRPTITLPPLP